MRPAHSGAGGRQQVPSRRILNKTGSVGYAPTRKRVSRRVGEVPCCSPIPCISPIGGSAPVVDVWLLSCSPRRARHPALARRVGLLADRSRRQALQAADVLAAACALREMRSSAPRRCSRAPESPLGSSAACGSLGRSSRAELAESAKTEPYAAVGRPRRGALSGPESLTPSARRIADLPAEGHPIETRANAPSRRTVEGHLTSIYRKLGVSARGALSDALANRPSA